MNLSAAYNLLPDYSQSYPGVRPKVHYPLSTLDHAPRLNTETDMQRSGQETGSYKYYVLSDNSEMVYNRSKNTEKLYSIMKGSLVNLYV